MEKWGESMTRAQNMIIKYINQQFVPGSVTIIPVGESHVKITDKNKESLTFTVNIFGDIIDADTNNVVAKADFFFKPESWTNQPGNYNWS